MVELALEELLVGFGSLLEVATVAVLQTEYGMPFTVAHGLPLVLKVEALTLMVMIARPPTLSVPIEQLTVPETCVHVPCVVLTFTNVICAGSGSETVTFCATAGPLLVTCSVYVRLVL